MLDDRLAEIWDRRSCDYAPLEGQSRLSRVFPAVASDMAWLMAEVERLRVETTCDGCFKVEETVKGICDCGGTGLLTDMLTTVRCRLADAYAEVERLQVSEKGAYESLGKYAKEIDQLKKWAVGVREAMDTALRFVDACVSERAGAESRFREEGPEEADPRILWVGLKRSEAERISTGLRNIFGAVLGTEP